MGPHDVPAMRKKKGDDVFWCPACSQKHRGDLTEIKTGGVLHATCVGCRRTLDVVWKDGVANVRVAEAKPPGAGTSSATPVPAPARPAESAPSDAQAPNADAASAAAASAPPAPARTLPPSVPQRPAPATSPPAPAAAERGATPVPAPPAPGGSDTGVVPLSPGEAAAFLDTTSAPIIAASGSPRGTAKAREEAREEATEIVAELPAGTPLGRYTIEAPIGQGGMSTVYRAFDPTTNRYVAVKLMALHVSEAGRQRFLREIEVQANLRHPNLMPVFDRGEHEGRPYFVMELLYRPFTLTEIVEMARDGRISRYATLRPLEKMENLVRDVLVPVTEGVAIANIENGVVHRDLKPDNVLVDSRTLRAYVIDFGICHVLERRTKLASSVLAPTAEDAGILGTPRFLAPEQARGAVHERTDVWGLGAILHYCLSGEAPIEAASPITRAELKRRTEALREAEKAARTAGDDARAELCASKLARLEDTGLRTLDDLFRDAREGRYTPLPANAPKPLVAIAQKAMAPKTAERYVNPRSLSADLQAWVAGTPTRAMAEQGSSAAAVVQTVGGALRRHLVTGVLVVLGLAAGWLLASSRAPAAGGATAGGAEARLADVLHDVERLEKEAEAFGADAARLDSREAARAYDLLHGRADDLRARLAALGGVRHADEATARLAAVANRFGPPRVRLVLAPGSEPAVVEDVSRGGKQAPAAAGDVAFAPGEHVLRVGSHDAGAGKEPFRVPIRVPLVVRAAGESAERAPPIATVTVPLAPDAVPAGLALVVPGPGKVEYRGPPFGLAPAVPVEVRPFLIDRNEVTNREWARFLAAIQDDAERARRMPAAEFTPDAEHPKHFMAFAGTEDLPVIGVSPEDVLAYCAWRSKRDGAVVRLPTEAEWAVAAGVQSGHALPAGSTGDVYDADYVGALKPVGKVRDRDTSAYGVRGLLGNAREMVLEVRSAPGAPPTFLVKGAAVGDEPHAAAIRRVRPLAKDARDPATFTGFRCVREIP
jgi:serine/threonine protein kinase/formylglycine-generating enzyme required for sulfatase activity